jgi:hypothetical protein
VVYWVWGGIGIVGHGYLAHCGTPGARLGYRCVTMTLNYFVHLVWVIWSNRIGVSVVGNTFSLGLGS